MSSNPADLVHLRRIEPSRKNDASTRALVEAFSLAYGDDGATLDIAEIKHEEVNFADAFEMPF